jgi:hypothetical protein
LLLGEGGDRGFDTADRVALLEEVEACRRGAPAVFDEARWIDCRLVRESAENGTERASRVARVFATLTAMRKIQVFSDERPSKRSMPRSTPTQASWTTSSATARLRT